MSATDIADIRQRRLREIMEARFHGRQNLIAEAVGREPSYISRLLLPSGHRHRKRLGEDLAREFERELRLTPGWFDVDSQGDLLPSSNGAGGLQPPQSSDEPIAANSPSPQQTAATLARLESQIGALLKVDGLTLADLVGDIPAMRSRVTARLRGDSPGRPKRRGIALGGDVEPSQKKEPGT